MKLVFQVSLERRDEARLERGNQVGRYQQPHQACWGSADSRLFVGAQLVEKEGAYAHLETARQTIERFGRP